MKSISPSLAARMANEVYTVNNTKILKGFFSGKEFANTRNQQRLLTAEVGTRLINTRDAFGACGRGAGDYEHDLFVVFRGTTTSNYGADIFTDLRTGLNVSATGTLVHSGFNHAFNSLKHHLALYINQQTGAPKCPLHWSQPRGRHCNAGG